jgi:hypothetical protein
VIGLSALLTAALHRRWHLKDFSSISLSLRLSMAKGVMSQGLEFVGGWIIPPAM